MATAISAADIVGDRESLSYPDPPIDRFSEIIPIDRDIVFRDERHAKRRKLEQQRNSQNSPHQVDDSDDGNNPLDDIVGFRHVPSAFQERESVVQRRYIKPENPRTTVEDGTVVREAKSFEQFVVGGPLTNSKRRRDSQRRRGRDDPGTPRSSFASSHSDTIDLLDSEVFVKPIVKTPYQCTAFYKAPLQAQANLRGKCGRRTGDRSPHFPMSDTAKPADQQAPVPSAVNGKPISAETRLRDQYRDTNGRRRSGADQSSSDELLAAEPTSRALSPVKTAGSQTPVKASQRGSPAPTLIGDDSFDAQQIQSNIRPSTFTQPWKHAAHPPSMMRQGNNTGEASGPWSIPIHAYNLQGLTHQGDNLELVYSDRDNCYEIHQSGQNLAKRNPELRIQPGKLHKIFWAREGIKMRFHSSKVGTYDGVLDIELCSEKDVQQLNAILQTSDAISVKGEDKARMDKLFDHRLMEQQKSIASGRTSPSKAPDDVVLAQHRLKRADAKREPDTQRCGKPKRPRIIDALGRDGQSGSTQQSAFRHPLGVRRTQRNRNPATHDQPDELSLPPLDGMPKRWLRSRDPDGYSFRKPGEIPSHRIEPEIQRYSKTHDMGRPWVRPVVYPKEGKKRTTVEWSDLERLDEGQFLNDNLVAFYLRYLEHQAEQRDPSISRKVYTFNTFFYERLTNTKRGDRGINYEAVRKWTRGVDLFTYDFVVVPVNESYHWYVAIICNLPALNRKLGGLETELDVEDGSVSEQDAELANNDPMLFSSSPPKGNDNGKENNTAASFAELSLEQNKSTDQDALDDQLRDALGEGVDAAIRKAGQDQQTGETYQEIFDVEKATSPRMKKGKRRSGPSPRKFDPYKPTILTFDSLGATHSATTRVLKQYLHEEANDKRGQMEFDEKEMQGVTAKEIPQQSNWYDCGLYILGYLAKFFENPRDFVDKVMRKEWNVDEDWPNLDPGSMRHDLRRILQELHAEQVEERVEARRAKSISKSPHAPASKPPRKDQAGEQLPETRATQNQHTSSYDKAVPQTVQAIGQDWSKIHVPEPESSGQATADMKPLPEPEKPAAPSYKEPPKSIILIDSQSQRANPATSAQDFELPSTIPDSQAPVAEAPLEDCRHISPPATNRAPRRIESFSSPVPTTKPAPKPDPEIKPPPSTNTNDAEPMAPKTRSMKRFADSTSTPFITGTDPKVVIHIDD
ncbi:MAG: hypothetical protein Q9184_005419 [Pyrenodesmia sp. 2 TL-2023]